jgi:predicted DNA-binding transcriptional regulator AlpA
MGPVKGDQMTRAGGTVEAARALAFLSERQLAAILSVSVKSLQGWRLRGRGPAWKKLGGNVRYPLLEFQAWVQAQPGGGGG